MRHNFIYFIIIAALFAAPLTGCEPKPDDVNAAEVMALEASSVRQAPEKADPVGAIKAIYAEIPEYSAVVLTPSRIEEVVGIPSGRSSEIYAWYSDPKSGLADVVIVKPHKILVDEVREMLYQYKERRVKEFENYDILDSYSIAQNAVVYDQGEYLILLMLSDNEAAQNIIDGYIPL